MKIKHLSVLILCIFNGLATLADENDTLNLFQYNNKGISYSSIDDNWIKVKTNQNISFGEEFEIAWSLSDSLSVNLSVFENQSNNSYTNLNSNTGIQQKSFNKFITKAPDAFDVNKNISGYKFGISSQLDMGDSYTVNINLDYGQLEDANLAGFYSTKVNTSSFELGIRKSKFGASILTDSYLENNIDILDHTRVGFELDWYFSKNTTLSFGSKQRYNKSSYIKQSNSLDNLTGNVQYIKFQRNL